MLRFRLETAVFADFFLQALRVSGSENAKLKRRVAVKYSLCQLETVFNAFARFLQVLAVHRY